MTTYHDDILDEMERCWREGREPERLIVARDVLAEMQKDADLLMSRLLLGCDGGPHQYMGMDMEIRPPGTVEEPGWKVEAGPRWRPTARYYLGSASIAPAIYRNARGRGSR